MANVKPFKQTVVTRQLGPQHARAATTTGVAALRDCSGKIPLINGDSPDIRAAHVNRTMKERGLRVAGIEDGLGTPLGTVSQESQVYLARARGVDAEAPLHVRVEGVKERHRICDVLFDEAQAAPFCMYPGKVFGLVGSQKQQGQGAIRGAAVRNPLPPPTARHAHLAAAKAAAEAPTPTKVARTDGAAAAAAAGAADAASVSPFKMCVIAGPFTPYASSSLGHVERVLRLCLKKGDVSVLLVVGPLCKERPEDDVGYLEEDERVCAFPREMHEKFAGRVLPKMVFVPSIDDAFHEFVFPQPGYSMDTEGLEDKVLALSNPARFAANGVEIGVTSFDVLRSLRVEMTSVAAKAQDFPPVTEQYAPKPAAKTALSEFLAAATFAPVLPPPAGLPLDVSLSKHLDFGATMPDILILPSLQPFAVAELLDGKERPDDRVVVVNPGFFSCPTTGGRHRIADIVVSASGKGSVWEQTSVDFYFLEEAEERLK
eukprot:Rhum_TRINITY_DN17027_c0_g1::Rhum_TRINITY_DN17027_c0_g1_i1::g.165096::m.165096/K02321/POLA2; DNA polymerase alpha subunit B